MLQGDLKRLCLTSVERKETTERVEGRVLRPLWSDSFEKVGMALEQVLAMMLDLKPNGIGNQTRRKVIQQTQNAQLVEMNDRTGIQDDEAGRPISHGHAVPSRHPRE